jgi:predicted membrane metal-binding protein
MRQWITFLLVFSVGPPLLFALIGWISRSFWLSVAALLFVGVLVDRWLRKRENPRPDEPEGSSDED